MPCSIADIPNSVEPYIANTFLKSLEQEKRFTRFGYVEAVAANRCFRRARHSWGNFGFRLRRIASKAMERFRL